MERNATCKGIVLRNYRIGEMHKGVVLLSDRFGLVSAIAHGAYSQKGKLRGVTNMFCSGTFYLYHNPTKNSTKITDVAVDEFHRRIRDELSSFYAASLWAEIIVKSYAGGEDGARVFALLRNALGALEREIDVASRASVQFIWRYLAILGVQPTLRECAATGGGLEVAESATYSRLHGGFVTPAFSETGDIEISAGARRYLEHTTGLGFDDALSVRLDSASLASLKSALFAMAQDTVDSGLNTLRIGEAFL